MIDPPDGPALDAFVASLSPSEYYVAVDAARDAFKRRSKFNVIERCVSELELHEEWAAAQKAST